MRITESQLRRIVKKLVKEQHAYGYKAGMAAGGSLSTLPMASRRDVPEDTEEFSSRQVFASEYIPEDLQFAPGFSDPGYPFIVRDSAGTVILVDAGGGHDYAKYASLLKKGRRPKVSTLTPRDVAALKNALNNDADLSDSVMKKLEAMMAADDSEASSTKSALEAAGLNSQEIYDTIDMVGQYYGFGTYG
jgi:hypothetical protein